jgi:FdrA protein
MSVLRFRVKPNLYRDSVALMRLSSALLARPGLSNATVMMATPANCAALAGSGFELPGNTRFTPDDLVLVVQGASETEVNAALDWAEAELARPPTATVNADTAVAPRTLQEGLRLGPGANLALISVPGDYAYAEALKALRAGLHVFLFSSGVAIEDEARLKQFATERGLLLMGAEAGTAIINGVPLGFANAVRRGSIGLVAASGSGLQEVMCLIHNAGGGISQAIGTGGRDLHEGVGATTMLAGLRLLQDDADTRVIVLLSKRPAPFVAARVLEVAVQTTKPTIVCFLGDEAGPIREAGLIPAYTLEEAARLALMADGQLRPESLSDETPSLHKSSTTRRFVRGLFAGGTLCREAILILQEALGPIAHPSVAQPWPPAHSCLDLGDEEFTRGRPHPMIDARLRAEKLLEGARDPQTAVMLFDVILGYGASSDPTTPLIQALQAAGSGPMFVAHVCGTDGDPQDLRKQLARLHEAGVVVAPTNAAAARLAAEMVQT